MTKMASKQASLENLVVDEQALNETLLADVLSKYVRIGEDSGSIYPKDSFENLRSDRKTAIVLLTQHAKSVLDMAESEWLSPSDIVAISGLKDGTVRPKVRELVDRGLAEDDDGIYRIPAPNLRDAVEFINGGSDE